MSDIELIPADYAAVRQLRKLLLRLAVLIAVVIVTATGARAWLAWRITIEQPIVAALGQNSKAADDTRLRLAALRLRKSDTEGRVAALQALRDGAAWETIFRAIDAAHDPDLWLVGLSYLRETTIEPALPPAPGASPAAATPLTAALGVRLLVEVQGHAGAHPTVTGFMRALGEQPGVGNVRLDETGLRRVGTADIVDFRLAGTLRSVTKAAP